MMVTKRLRKYTATHTKLFLCAMLVVVIVAFGVLVSCDDGGSSPDLILRVFYKGGGLVDFDALTFERLKYYEGIEGDLCAFNDVTGEIWVARGDKVFKYDKDGRYEFGGVQLKAKAADIVVNKYGGNAWIFCENGTVYMIDTKGPVNNRPNSGCALPHPHTGNTEYFLEPDHYKGGCWVIAKNKLYYFYEWGTMRLGKEYPQRITAASARPTEMSCWLATFSTSGAAELVLVNYMFEMRDKISGGGLFREAKCLRLAGKPSRFWLVDYAKRNNDFFCDLKVISPGGKLIAMAPNVPNRPELVVDAETGYAWYYGRTGTAMFLLALDENGENVYERLRVVSTGNIGRDAEAFQLLRRSD